MRGKINLQGSEDSAETIGTAWYLNLLTGYGAVGAIRAAMNIETRHEEKGLQTNARLAAGETIMVLS